MLFTQALEINPSALTSDDHPITVTALREAVSESDWLSLLNRALCGIPYVYIVIDADLLNRGKGQSRYTTARLIETVPKLVTGTVAKLFVSNLMIDESYVARNWDPERWIRLKTECVDVRQKVRNKFMRQRRKTHKRGRF